MKSSLFALILLLAILMRLFISVRLYSGDVNNHIAWGKEITMFGIQGIYEREFTEKYKVMPPTYPPIAISLFAISYEIYLQTIRIIYTVGRLAPSLFTDWVISSGHPNFLPAFFKLPSILADIGIAVLLYQITIRQTKSINKSISVSLLALFNPAIWFNSAAWGQIESIPIFFLLLGSLFLLEERFLLSSISVTLAILTKQSAIIFLPFFFAYLFSKKGFFVSIKALLLQLLIFLLVFLPFNNIFDLFWPFRIFMEKLSTGSGSDYVTDHAFNFWFLVVGSSKIPDSLGWLFGIPYSTYGSIFVGAAGIWLLINTKKMATIDYLWKAWILILLSTFFLATRMHERYLGPALILFLLPWGKWNRLIILGYLYLSGFHLINLYHNWWEPNIFWLIQLLSFELGIKILTVLALGIYLMLLIKWTKNATKT